MSSDKEMAYSYKRRFFGQRKNNVSTLMLKLILKDILDNTEIFKKY